MGRFSTNLIWTAISAALFAGFTLIFRAVFKAIFTVEVEEYWNLSIQPYLAENGWRWVATMLEFVPTFWGGVAVTLALLLVVDRLRHRLFNCIDPKETTNHDTSQIEVEYTLLSEVAAEVLSRIRGTEAHIPINYAAYGTGNELRRVADLITKWNDVYGRIPHTKALQKIGAGNYFTGFTEEGDLVAVEVPGTNQIAFIDLKIPTADVEQVISSTIHRVADALGLEANVAGPSGV
jgi:hypothetical protein